MLSWRCLLLTLALCFCSLGARAGALQLDDRLGRVDAWSASIYSFINRTRDSVEGPAT